MILLRECNIYVYIITSVFTDQLIFKSWDKASGTDL